MMDRKLAWGLVMAVAVTASGCYAIGNEGGGGGGMGDQQGALSDNEPTDDNGVDEFGTHHRPRYHPRRDPSKATNDHASGISGSGASSGSGGTP